MQIILQVWDPNMESETISLDDIHIIRDRFCNATASDMDCSFEHGDMGQPAQQRHT